MFCKNCGYKLKDDENFCTNCGAKTDEIGTENNKTKEILKISLTVLICFLVTASLIFYCFKKNSSKTDEIADNTIQEKVAIQENKTEPKEEVEDTGEATVSDTSVNTINFTPEFCSPLLEGECTDYDEDVVDYFITQKIDGKYYIKVFPKDKRMPDVLVPYPDKDSMYKDFENNWKIYIEEAQKSQSSYYGWDEIYSKFDKVKE